MPPKSKNQPPAETPSPQTWHPSNYAGRGPVSILTKITPDLATRMLEGNTHNRPVNDHDVARFVIDMVNGKWLVTHQGIAFSEEGVLVDGQHRLWAIVNSEKTITMMVSYNIDPDSLKVIDVGRVRTVGQTSDLYAEEMGIERGQGRKIVSRAAIIKGIEERRKWKDRFLQADAEEILGRHREGLLWSVKAMTGSKGGDAAPVSGALAYAYPTDRERIEKFAKQVRDGELLVKADPAFSLRSFILGGSAAGPSAKWMLTMATLRAASAFIHEERLSVIRINTLTDSAAEKTTSVGEEILDFFGKVHRRAVPPKKR